MSSAIAKAPEELSPTDSGLWASRLEFLLHQFRGDSLRSRIARGAFWSVLGTGISQALGLFATVICARLLGSAVYGQLGLVLTTVNLRSEERRVGKECRSRWSP